MSEFLREAQWALWAAAAIGLGLLELTSLDFFFSMLVIGALAAAGTAALGLGLAAQFITFSLVSGLGLIVGRPFLKRLAARSAPEQPTNVDALAGRPAVVLEAVTDRGGLVKLAGETWSARTASRGRSIPEGSDVVVDRIDGATAIVRAETDAPGGTSGSTTENPATDSTDVGDAGDGGGAD